MIDELKALLFSILELAYKEPDVNITQQLGVQMSNAVKKDGVVIIQNQNVEIYARIVPQLIKAIKMCDSMQVPQITNAIELAHISATDIPDMDPVVECCKHFYDSETKWQDMQEVMRTQYLEYVTGKFHTKAAAAKWLGIGSTYLSKLTREDKKDEPIAS